MLFTPSIDHLWFHNESSLRLAGLPEKITRTLMDQIDSENYERFGRNKFLKPYFDNYALYYPFSESLRAFYPFVSAVKEAIKPGDIILDLSNRTGWTAFLLASFFPENKIISCWSGNTDVLGYQGFNYWFNAASTHSNITIKFLNLQEKLPFEDASIRVVFGYDTLHHQCRSTLLPEIKRLIPDDGFVFFPHVHLANNQPEPFFRRGGDLLLGTDYEKFFAAGFPNHKAFVFSEPELFEFQSVEREQVGSNADTADYNGLVALVPKDFSKTFTLQPYAWQKYHDLAACQALFNPMLRIDINGVVEFSPVESFRHHLSRHPCYLTKLTKAIGYQLDDTERKILYFIGKGLPIETIFQKTPVEWSAFQESVEKLERMDIIAILGVSEAARRLQYFFSTQKWPEVSGERTLAHLWRKSCVLYSDSAYLADLSTGSFTFGETDQIVRHVVASLRRSGATKGDVFFFQSSFSPVSVAIFWAGVQLGMVGVPVNLEMKETEIQELIAQFQPILFFTKEKFHTPTQNVFFEGDEDDPQHFSNWLDNEPADVVLDLVYEEDPAVILFTSGSTGKSKGVILTHAQLFGSATNILHTYAWRDADVLLAVGDMGSMSGLRNNVLVTALAGSSVVIMDPVEMQLPNRLAESMLDAKVTVLAGSPAFYLQLLRLRNPKAYTKNIRLGLVTGSNFSQHLLHRLESELNLTMRNYYGLTETTGICIGEYLSESYESAGSIGHCVDALVKIQPTGDAPTKGELYVFSEQITRGYFGNNDQVDLDEAGWFRTKDLVQLLDGEKIKLVGRISNLIKNQRSEIIHFSHVEEEIERSGIAEFAVTSALINDLETIVIYLSNEIGDFDTTRDIIEKNLAQRFGTWTVPAVFRGIDSIPRKTNGKVNLEELLSKSAVADERREY